MYTIKLLLISFLLVFYTATVLANVPNYWQCYASDSAGQQWRINQVARQEAINQAWQLCKNRSNNPNSCQVAKEWCQFYRQGVAQVPQWRCMALDQMGKHWLSRYQRNREEAYSAAKDICEENSSMPSTCYVRLMTCKNNGL